MDSRIKLGMAFLAVYLIWGSTYLAIRFVVETIPPFFMAGTRFIIAGAVLYILTWVRGAQAPTSIHWRDAFVVGGLLLLGGNGAVVWAEQWIPSGLTSLLIATTALWMVLLNSLRHRTKPTVGGTFGLLLGFAGVALLVGGIENTGDTFMVIPAAVVTLGAFLWACGSLYSRSAETLSSQLQSPAMQMVAGGILLLSASLITGEWKMIMLDKVSLPSVFSWLYLIIFGSLVGFSSYMWLLKHAQISRVSTHAYVNPLVAVILGWTLAEEALTASNVIAAIIIIMSVAVITTFPAEREKTASKS